MNRKQVSDSPDIAQNTCKVTLYVTFFSKDMEIGIINSINHFFAAPKLMISTGYPRFGSTNTEVIDLEDSQDLHNFPTAITGAVGANLASMPIICGGLLKGYINSSYYSDSSDKCFKYVKGGWQNFVTMMDRRHSAAGIVHNNSFHIFGGYDNYPDSYESAGLQSSEIINKMAA